MTKKEYEQQVFNQLGTLFKIFYFIGVYQFRTYSDLDGDWWMEDRVLNPYNPISYIIFPTTYLILGLFYGFSNVNFKDMLLLFKYE